MAGEPAGYYIAKNDGFWWSGAYKGASYSSSGSSTPTMLIGARVAPFGTYTTVASVQAKIGTLQVGRVFHDAGLPTNWSSTMADSGMNGMPSNAGCIISTKTANSNYASYIASIPNELLDAGHIWMTMHHEPEGDYSSGSQFVAEYTTFYNAIKAIDSRVKIGPIAEGDKYGRYPLGDATSGSYLPPDSICDFYGIDLYHPMNGQAAPKSNDPETVTNMTDFIDWTVWTGLVGGYGKPLLIAEWGMYAEPDQYNTGSPNIDDETIKQANRATMIPLWVQQMRDAGVEAVSYWYVDGKSGEHGTFRPSDDASNAALAGLERGAL